MTTSRYIRYLSTFTASISGNNDAQSDLYNVNFTWASSSGVFTSQCHPVGGISSFGNFSVIQDVTTGGSIAYNVCSSPNSNCSSPTCKVVSANSQITVSTGAFVDFIATFTVVASTNSPKLQSATIQWYSGNRSPTMASAVWDNRYWLSLTTTTTDSANDAILIMNRSEKWAIYDIHAGGLTIYKNSLYHSDSNPSGNVYLDNSGQNDNGAAINMFIKTKDYPLTDLSEDKYIDSIYTTSDNSGNFNIGTSYYLDRSTTAFALSNINQTEYGSVASVKLPFPIDASHQGFGRTVAYKFQEADVNALWNFYGFIQVYKVRPPE